MARDMKRMLAPRSIAVVGGGKWCASIIGAARQIGFKGDIFPVHPGGKEIAGMASVRSLSDWAGEIDVAFIGVNRHATIDIVGELRSLGAGGAVCFASGFSEAHEEDASGVELQGRLLDAAGDMPIFGPNCYGFVNALDGAAIWPDQHGMSPVDSGVAILTQSSNIAINMTMQRRGLPIGYMLTCGNMAQTSQSELALAMLDDPRVTAIGLHIEGFGDLRQWEALARAARARNVPVVALKVGASEQARRATVSHTASLAGSDAGAQALLDRLGFVRVRDLPEFLETLKLLHCVGPLASNRIASISCSGGEASLIADLAEPRDLVFPALEPCQKDGLRAALGLMVALANPLDYHTYIWGDAPAMTRAWSGMTGADIALTLSVVDYPHTDASAWECATEAALGVRRETGRPFAVVSSLPELMPSDVAQRLMGKGVAPLCGMREALVAAEAAARLGRVTGELPDPVLLPGQPEEIELIGESEAKQALAGFGLDVPQSRLAGTPEEAAGMAGELRAPLVLKGTGLAHKSEHGAVVLGLTAAEIEAAATGMSAGGYLVEEMIGGTVAELLVGVTLDPAHGFVLTIGAGGVQTELLRDTVSMLVPSDREAVASAVQKLACAPVLNGYRGRPGICMTSLLDAVDAVQAYVAAHAETLSEIEINPLICTPERAVAADALIRKAKT
ncbi:acetate--CoA ligase family protein [Heliomarina baculiformis]|uniref:acetate--CoA ligase family protein n=1 Tax=Heliomarina baculiformis TaxID=2872036 RepID=UPI001EE19EDA|nr:acetate--CoA ligase family protein [Heliomarina baculiformis]